MIITNKIELSSKVITLGGYMREKNIEIKANMKMGEFADIISALHRLEFRYLGDKDIELLYKKFIDNFKWKEI